MVMTKEIQLTQGQVALVDDEWFDELNQYMWCATYNEYTKSFYAVRSSSILLGKRKTIRMHRFIMNAPKGMEVDHRDRNTLNNQVSNLRICTRMQNSHNREKDIDNSSGYKGVRLHRDKWQARIGINNTEICLGNFSTKEEAALAYNDAAIKYFGEFANLNKIP
jgi:hypothetical protein